MQGLPTLEVVEQGLKWNARASEHGCTTKDVDILDNDLFAATMISSRRTMLVPFLTLATSIPVYRPL